MAVRSLILLACFVVAACAELPSQLGQNAQAEPPRPVEPRYCYKTLGKVNCYSQPLDGKEANRLVGYEGPAPRPNAGTGPLSP
ncbi:hypothetical protein NUH88_18755 [Nisaea acidiphila]|uniref:Lipoprotein n=1 Tax=Nisaea acidiphila TaxID=1862145 RepID=A0A9J7AVJ1_9PROT|nr:hypothetical protein [Nisaea acidiphila]UUX49429.1 hypothetical protein NUH88_18755 [Nisaea acidiphila]